MDCRCRAVAAWRPADFRFDPELPTPNSRALHLIAVLPPAEALPRLGNDGAACSGSGAARA
jgi:hypothetical protein